MTDGNRVDGGTAGAVWAMLEHLADNSAVPSWAVLRSAPLGSVVLAAHDREFGLVAGQAVTPGAASADRLVGADVRRSPIFLPDGSLFGELIGIPGIGSSNSTGATDDMISDGSLVELFAASIGALYGSEIAIARDRRTLALLAAPADTLTGLATRQAWERQLREEELRCTGLGTQAGVIVVELDELRTHNEIHGHESGDVQIRNAAQIVTEATGIHFTARVTGNVIGAILAAAGPTEVAAIERAVRQALSSAGIPAAIGTGQRTTVTGLRGAVAEAMAAVAAIQVVQRQAPATSAIAAANSHLVEALDRGMIRAYFQPIVDLRSGEVVTIEALARWQAEDGVREPDLFLPQLAEAGLLGALFDRILDDGLEHLAEFRHIAPRLTLAVNFEFDTIPDSGLLDGIRKRLEFYSLPTESLAIELSERQTFDLPAQIRDQLAEVAAAGVQLTLDDFGTGFASLETLTSLPITGV
ncbi:MAG: GGDEF domain-containing phosphodiesterase, partial [Ilumatobacteraceae bacterium]